MIIAIDGPAGSGKTTIAKLLALKLAILYLDTGALYRALTLSALENHIDIHDACALSRLAQTLEISFHNDRVLLAGRDITQEIRTPLIDKNISVVVAHPEVRAVMVALQRAMAGHASFVVEGRDITTVVFPQAEYKFYLDADPIMRAERRFKELKAKGVTIDFQEMKDDLERRDLADITRKVGSLQRSPDAYFIDTTELSIEQVVEKMLEHVKSKRITAG